MADTPTTGGGDHEPGQTGGRESWAGARAENADVRENQGQGSAESRETVDVLKHFKDANRELGLTSQEQGIYAHHLNNLAGGTGYDHGDGSRSTYFGVTVGGQDLGGDPSKTYMIPTVHDGGIVGMEEALDRARKIGADQHAAYDSPDAAKARYDQIHAYMDRDTEDHMHRNEPQDSPLRRQYLSHRSEAVADVVDKFKPLMGR